MPGRRVPRVLMGPKVRQELRVRLARTVLTEPRVRPEPTVPMAHKVRPERTVPMERRAPLEPTVPMALRVRPARTEPMERRVPLEPMGLPFEFQAGECGGKGGAERREGPKGRTLPYWG